MKKIVLILIISCFLSTDGLAQVYKWVDDQGGVHFTDDVTKIPDSYRKRVEKVGLAEDQVGIKEEGELPSKKKEDSYKDQLGRGEDYWKKRVEEWRKRLKEAQERNENARIKYNELTERYNDSKSSVERNQLRRERDQFKQEMDQCRTQIEEARMMLEKKIPEEAKLYQAREEWLK